MVSRRLIIFNLSHSAAENTTQVRRWPRLARSPAQQRRPPGEPAAHGLEQDEIAALDSPIRIRVRERQRDRRGRGVAVAVDGGDDLAGIDTELVRRAVDDAL